MRYVQGLLIAYALTGCVRHIRPYEKKVRSYERDAYAADTETHGAGSLWRADSPGLFEDARAARIGDIVTVKIDERSDATRDAKTQTSRDSSVDLGITAFFGAMQSLVAQNPGLSAEQLLSASSGAEFKGGGSTSRSGTLQATLPVRIKSRMPNGDFYIEGSKALLVNDEESHLYVSGVVRPIDIEPDNSVWSERLADVELEYTGRGVISERQSPGWFSRVLDWVWPF